MAQYFQLGILNCILKDCLLNIYKITEITFMHLSKFLAKDFVRYLKKNLRDFIFQKMTLLRNNKFYYLSWPPLNENVK